MLRKKLADSKTLLISEERKERSQSLDLLPTSALELEVQIPEKELSVKETDEEKPAAKDKSHQVVLPLIPKEIRKKVRTFESALISHRKPTYEKLRKNLLELSQKKLPVLADVCL